MTTTTTPSTSAPVDGEDAQTIGEITTATTIGRVTTAAGRTTYDRVVLLEAYPDRADDEIVDTASCGRCGGDGYLVGFGHIDNGRCFACAGRPATRKITAVEARADAKKRIERENAAERKRIKRLATADVEWQRIEAIEPIWSHRDTEKDSNEFIANLVEKVMDGHQLSDKQITAGAEAMRRDAERRQARAAEAAARERMAPLEAGRRELTLTVISTRWDDNPYGAGATRKMLAEDEAGYRYWSTVPRALINETVTEGTQIRLTATVKPSERDKTFGLLSRPAKATTQG